MTQDKRGSDIKRSKESDAVVNKRNDTTTHSSKDSVGDIPSKVVIRRLPPSLTAETFLEHISPVPDYDYFRFAEAEHGLGPHAFSRAYINFVNPKDIWIFEEKFDGYIFLDEKGNEYPAVVEFAPYPRVSKKKNKKPDPRKGTIEQDPDYSKYVEKLKNLETETVPPPESLLEEIEAREKLLKANHGCPKIMTPLIEFLTKKKEEKRSAFLHAREEKRRKEIEKRKQFEEERRKKIEKERREANRLKQKEKEDKKKDDNQTSFRLLRNLEREKEDERERLSGQTESQDNRMEADIEKAKPTRDDDLRGKEQDKRSNLDVNDRRADERKDGKDKGRRPDKTFGERRREEDRRKDSESSSAKDSSYGISKRSDQYGHQGQKESDRDRYKDRTKETTDSSEKDANWERGQERENGSRSGGYHSYRGGDRDGKPRERDSYRDGKREDGRRDAKGDYKFDSRRPKDSGKATGKDSRYPKSEPGHGDHGGGRQYYQESRGQSGRKGGSYDNRKDSGNYDNRKDSGNYDNQKDGGNYDNQRDSEGRNDGRHGNNTEKLATKTKTTDDNASDTATRGEKEKSPQGEETTRRGSSDATELASKGNKVKLGNDEEAGSAAAPLGKKGDDFEISGRRNSDKDVGSSKQRVRYKDRPERAIYNPAKRAVERQKEVGSNR